MRTIQIGIEVHKAIEAERKDLGEAENDILMRLLKLKSAPTLPEKLHKLSGISWAKDGVELPSGTHLRVNYSGQQVDGIVDDGQWVIGNASFASPSMALINNVTTHKGKKTNLNGWNHWTVKRPGDSRFIRLNDLRAIAKR